MLLLSPTWAHETGLPYEAEVPRYHKRSLLINWLCKVCYALTRVTFQLGCIIFIINCILCDKWGLEVEASGKVVVWMFSPRI